MKYLYILFVIVMAVACTNNIDNSSNNNSFCVSQEVVSADCCKMYAAPTDVIALPACVSYYNSEYICLHNNLPPEPQGKCDTEYAVSQNKTVWCCN